MENFSLNLIIERPMQIILCTLCTNSLSHFLEKKIFGQFMAPLGLTLISKNKHILVFVFNEIDYAVFGSLEALKAVSEVGAPQTDHTLAWHTLTNH